MTDTNPTPERTGFTEGVDYTRLPVPPALDIDDAFWQIPVTPIEDRTNPEPTLTSASEGADYTVLYTNPAFAPPAPPAPPSTVPPKRKAPWIAAGAAAVIIPGLALLIGIGVGTNTPTDAAAAQATPTPTTEVPACGPNNYTATCVLARGEVPNATATGHGVGTPPLRAWIIDHPEVYSATQTIQDDLDAMGTAGEAGLAVSMMSLCESAIDDVDDVMASDAYTDPNAPDEFRDAMLDYRRAFTFCALGDFESTAASIGDATANISTLTEMIDAL